MTLCKLEETNRGRDETTSIRNISKGRKFMGGKDGGSAHSREGGYANNLTTC